MPLAMLFVGILVASLILALSGQPASAQPGLTATASGNTTAGATVTDTAVLEANQPTGTLTFVLYGPNDPTCSSPAFTSVVPINGSGSYTSAPAFQLQLAGTYSWIASYSGDDLNPPATTSCGDPGQVFTASTASVILTAASAVSGTMLTDTATLSQPAAPPPTTTNPLAIASLPTGNLFFSLFGPSDAACANTPLFTSAIGVNGFGAYPSSPSYSAKASGVYRWTVTYSGDANYAPVTLTCTDPSTVALPVSTTTAPPGTTVTTTHPSPTTTTSTTNGTTTTTTSRAPTSTTTSTSPARTVPPKTTPGSTGPKSSPPTSASPGSPPSGPTSTGPRSGGPALTALTPAGESGGPAGAGLNVGISGLPAQCKTAYFFFNGTRIGSANVHDGSAAEGSISIPGDEPAGFQTITVSCNSSDQSVVAATTYQVVHGSVQRSELLTSLNQPREVALTAKSIAISAGVAVGGIVLLAFPAQIFNGTLIEHYEEVRRWFGLRRPLSEVINETSQRVLLPIFIVGGGVLFALLTPGFAFNLSTLALVLGLSIAVAVTTFGLALPTFIYFGVERHERGRILVMPGTLVLGLAFVVVSRIIDFEPGYLYGVLAVFLFRSELDRRRQGVLAAVSALMVMGIAFLLWWARVPLAGSTMAHPNFWSVVLESALGGAFVMGVESTVVAMLPLRSLDGERIKAWSRVVWLIVFLLAVITFVQVLIQPGTGYVGHISTGSELLVGALYVIFAAISFGFWAYFRFRETPEEEAHPEEDEFEREGELDVR